MAARDTALSVLIACRKQRAWADGCLKERIQRDRLDRRDAALCTRLCYGVLQNRMLLDYYLEQLTGGKLRRVQPVVLDILRLGLYQLLFMDRIPDSAAVNEAVNQARERANVRAAGFVNAVLRSALREREELTPPQDLSISYSHPEQLVALLRESVGDTALEQVLSADNAWPQTVIQINTLRASADEVRQQIESVEGAEIAPHPWLRDCFMISGIGSLEALPAYQDGLFYVQDAASRLAVLCASIRPGMRVLDCCAAPGGKSFAAAIDMKNTGKVRSADIHRHKITLIEHGAERMGLTCISTRLQDATAAHAGWDDHMDVVLADVPCSGLGIIRKKPDIRYKDLKETERLPELQLKILWEQAKYVKPGGLLMYSTCTVLNRENRDVVQKFLRSAPEFCLEQLPLPEGLPQDGSGMLTLLPGPYDTDGFFICRMRRKA